MEIDDENSKKRMKSEVENNVGEEEVTNIN
jgi:hypothetical protein